MAHDAFLDPYVIIAPDDVTQAVVSVVIMQQFSFVTGGRADCEHTAVKMCKLYEDCLQGYSTCSCITRVPVRHPSRWSMMQVATFCMSMHR